MKPKPSLVLASSSKSRKLQLQQMHMPFEICPPNIDETQLPGEPAEKMVLRLAHAKAIAVSGNYPNHLIIAGDQVQLANQTIQGKPLTHANAVQQLRNASNRITYFFSGLCVLNSATNEVRSKLITTEVKFKLLNDQMIEKYIQLDCPLECAGSIRIEGMAMSLIDSIKTTDPMAIIGLPLLTLCQLLNELGFCFLSDNPLAHIDL